MARMREDTPYHERPPQEVARERDCMRKVLSVAPPVPLVFDAFGGTGDTALIMRELFPGVRLYASDLDQQCCDTYRRRVPSPRTVRQGDSREAFAYWAQLTEPLQWGASLDFNKFTLLAFEDRSSWKVKLIDRVVAHKPAWVQITDSAVRYLHLNWQRYGAAGKAPEQYAERLGREMRERYGLYLAEWANHPAAMYLLFKPGDN